MARAKAKEINWNKTEKGFVSYVKEYRLYLRMSSCPSIKAKKAHIKEKFQVVGDQVI